MGKFLQFLMVLSAQDKPSCLFLSKHQWILTKIGMYIDIVEILFGIANGQISSNFDGVICRKHTHIFVCGW